MLTLRRLLHACFGIAAFALLASPASAAPARRSAKRPPKPKLLLELQATQAAKPPLQAEVATLQALLREAIRKEPLTIATLGLKNPKPARVRWTLRRRRLRAYAVTVKLGTLAHRVRPGTPRQLEGRATLEVTLKRLHQRRAKPSSLTATGQVAIPISVVLQAEVLAVRRAALEAAARDVIQQILKQTIRRR